MGRKKVPGLIQRDGIWHIDKRIGGRRVCQSTGTAQLEEAERFLVRRMEQVRQARVYGVRPVRRSSRRQPSSCGSTSTNEASTAMSVA